jgi:hypothetical protein
MTVETYKNYWQRAWEKTSWFPGALSFSNLKAGAQDEMIATFECIMTWIPLFSGYMPKRCLEKMLRCHDIEKGGAPPG